MAGKRSGGGRKPLKRAKAAKCCISGCTRPANRRGLCDCCYTLAYRAIKAGRVNWGQLERDGLAKPTKSDSSPFRMAQAAVAAR